MGERESGGAPGASLRRGGSSHGTTTRDERRDQLVETRTRDSNTY